MSVQLIQGPTREQVVYTEAEDGTSLAGLLIEPATAERKSTAIVWIHGGECNFYFLPYVRIGRVLAARGYTFISGNTRGHDTASWSWYRTATTGERFFGGQIWENYEDSPLDIAGWIAFAEHAGFGRICLAGQSAGAHKTPAYQAQRQDHRVVGLILASPALRPFFDTRAHPATLDQATRLVAEGRSEELVDCPFGLMSARTYLSLDRFGIDQFGRQNPEPAIARIACPILAIIGTNEPDISIEADLTIIREHATSAPRVETRLIEGADHCYCGHEEGVAAVIGDWLDRLAD
jgi:pimeloyl-ACP methyl ester carboxylesterase